MIAIRFQLDFDSEGSTDLINSFSVVSRLSYLSILYWPHSCLANPKAESGEAFAKGFL
jgi:hypothetical protein